ncbi:type 1 glutamine amidotransferase [Jannaschia sp.]|nr:type 1 glutamine amidotransferase [Jannaschia sp.]
MKIGILMTGHLPDPLRARMGDLDGMFERLLDGHGFSFQSFDIEGMAFPDGPDACDGWLITGSRHGVYEDHPFIPRLEAFIRDVHAADIPLVGICFGHQIVASALGGRVEKFDRGWALGRSEYSVEGAAPMHLNAWHQDQVLEAPKGARALGSNAFCKNAMLVYGDRMFTVQPHPEFEPDLIAAFVSERRGTGTYPDDLMDRAGHETAQPLDNARMGAALARFLKTRTAHV